MIEPTESESKAELDRFCDALIAIREEIREIETGKAPRDRQRAQERAAHGARSLTADEWDHPYSREQAAYPAPWVREHKFWPAVGPAEQRVRRPQPGLLLPSDRGVSLISFPDALAEGSFRNSSPGPRSSAACCRRR